MELVSSAEREVHNACKCKLSFLEKYRTFNILNREKKLDASET